MSETAKRLYAARCMVTRDDVLAIYANDDGVLDVVVYIAEEGEPDKEIILSKADAEKLRQALNRAAEEKEI